MNSGLLVALALRCVTAQAPAAADERVPPGPETTTPEETAPEARSEEAPLVDEEVPAVEEDAAPGEQDAPATTWTAALQDAASTWWAGLVEVDPDALPPVATGRLVMPRQGLLVFGQLYAGYRFLVSEPALFHEFVLERADVGIGYGFDDWLGFVVRYEAIRSGGPDSLFGVDGDSILSRFRHAFAFAEPGYGPVTLTLRAGLIPDVWIDTVQAEYDLRGLVPLAAERRAFFDTSDLGVSAAASLFDGILEARASFTNGEGRIQREQNFGKNTTALVSLRTPAWLVFSRPMRLAAHAAYRDGSLGAGSAPDHRVAGAATLAHPWFHLGLEAVYAFGHQGRGDLQTHAVGVWADTVIVPRVLGVAVRYDRFGTNGWAPSSGVHNLQAALFTDPFVRPAQDGASRVRLYGCLTGQLVEAEAGPLPGVPQASNHVQVQFGLEATGLFFVDDMWAAARGQGS